MFQLSGSFRNHKSRNGTSQRNHQANQQMPYESYNGTCLSFLRS